MTRKDYVALAGALHKAQPTDGRSTRGMLYASDYEHKQWTMDVAEIANVLAADNPRFDRERFLRAAQGEK